MPDQGQRLAVSGSFIVADVFRATLELGRARLRLTPDMARTQVTAPQVRPVALDQRQSDLIERVAYAIPRVAARLPWRADCLVQAIAARRWLARHGVVTTLTLGAPRENLDQFEAHAWLTAGDRLVTGGDISGYVPLARP